MNNDPAVEAAQRATNGPINGPVGAFALASAREALKPIREALQRFDDANTGRVGDYAGIGRLISEVRRLVDATEELKGGNV